ncbi:MAG TPA: riboflavin kinase, partial [Oligoflexia bacterium]|nr:riboflavin kinase [Oligoflexia bacterium]
MNKNKKKYPSITNVGVKPTFAKPEDQRPPVVIETHLFDFNDDLYGRTIEIELVERIRDEQKFDSIEKLVEQIRKDVAQTRQLFTI